MTTTRSKGGRSKKSSARKKASTKKATKKASAKKRSTKKAGSRTAKTAKSRKSGSRHSASTATPATETFDPFDGPTSAAAEHAPSPQEARPSLPDLMARNIAASLEERSSHAEAQAAAAPPPTLAAVRATARQRSEAMWRNLRTGLTGFWNHLVELFGAPPLPGNKSKRSHKS